MGVMSCFRKDCENIMCDTYIQGVGYICDGCQREFEELIKTNEAGRDLPENKLVEELKAFMQTPKVEMGNSEPISATEFFKKHTR